MGWKEDLREVEHNTDKVFIQLGSMERRQAAMNTKIDLVVRLVQEQMTRMSDRLIEMAMVNNGMGRDAAIHRRSLTEEAPTPPADLWQDNPENEWPPKGHDALNLP